MTDEDVIRAHIELAVHYEKKACESMRGEIAEYYVHLANILMREVYCIEAGRIPPEIIGHEFA